MMFSYQKKNIIYPSIIDQGSNGNTSEQILTNQRYKDMCFTAQFQAREKTRVLLVFFRGGHVTMKPMVSR